MAFGIERVTCTQTDVSDPSAVSHTVPSGVNLLYVFAISGADGTDFASASWNGVSLTLVDRQDSTATIPWGHIELWRLVNPTPGTGDVVINFNGASQPQLVAYNFTGADTINFGTFTSVGDWYNQADPVITGVPSTAGDIVIGCLVSDIGNNAVTTATSPGIQDYSWQDSSTDSDFCVQHITATGATTTLSWTCSDTSNGGTVLAAIAVKSGAVSGAINSSSINHPGRGPFSVGKFHISDNTAYTTILEINHADSSGTINTTSTSIAKLKATATSSSTVSATAFSTVDTTPDTIATSSNSINTTATSIVNLIETATSSSTVSATTSSTSLLAIDADSSNTINTIASSTGTTPATTHTGTSSNTISITPNSNVLLKIKALSSSTVVSTASSSGQNRFPPSLRIYVSPNRTTSKVSGNRSFLGLPTSNTNSYIAEERNTRLESPKRDNKYSTPSRIGT
jgi:hypothetical protein